MIYQRPADEMWVSGVGVQVSVFPHSLIIRRYIPTRHASTLSANKMAEKIAQELITEPPYSCIAKNP